MRPSNELGLMDFEKALAIVPIRIPALNQQTLETFKRFIRNKVVIGRKSSHTVEGYITAFILMFSYLDTTNLPDITREMVLAWLLSYAVGRKPATVLNRLSSLAVFFNYCMGKKIITQLPLRATWRPRLLKLLPKYIEASDLAKIALVAETLPIRNRALIEFIKSSGCRRAEAIGLRLSDIDLPNLKAIVTGKGNKRREVPFSPECSFLIRLYLDVRPEGGDTLFVTANGKRLAGRDVHRMVARLGVKAGLTKPLHPHRFRHTKATTMVEQGYPILEVKDLLGHKYLRTTMGYTFIFFRDIQLEYDRIMGE